MDHTRRLGRR